MDSLLKANLPSLDVLEAEKAFQLERAAQEEAAHSQEDESAFWDQFIQPSPTAVNSNQASH